MIRGFYTALSGVVSSMTRQAVVADNIANSNTVGFKQSRTSQDDFELQIMNSLGPRLGELGTGAIPTGLKVDTSQGPLEATGKPTDLAISGDGNLVDYYTRALKLKPSEVAVRTDMATAYWYMGNADSALAEFDKALSYSPNSPNTLFNRGLVRWEGKTDAAGAIADWEKLLATNPNYEARDNVVKMIAEVKQHAGNPAAKAK